MATKKTSLTLDEDVRQQAQEVLDQLGLSFSGAVELFLRAVIREKGLPFALTTRPMESGYVYALVKMDGQEEED